MTNSSWLDKQSGQDVQQAINTQSIQTALEKSSSALSDVAFQSYYTGAPTPRMFYETFSNAQVAGDGAEMIITWTNGNRVIDSHGFFDSNRNTTNFVIPVDGFYTINYRFSMTATNADRISEIYGAIKVVQSKRLAATFYPAVNRPVIQGSGLGVVLAYEMEVVLTYPFNAGDAFQGAFMQRLGGARTFGGHTHVGAVWIAPFYNYQGGN